MRCFLPTVRVFGNFPARTYAWTVWTFRWSASATSRVVYRWGRSGMAGLSRDGEVRELLGDDGGPGLAVRGGASCLGGLVVSLERDLDGLTSVRVSGGRAVFVHGRGLLCGVVGAVRRLALLLLEGAALGGGLVENLGEKHVFLSVGVPMRGREWAWLCAAYGALLRTARGNLSNLQFGCNVLKVAATAVDLWCVVAGCRPARTM